MIDYFLRTLLVRSPLLLVIMGGVLFAIVRWKRHPRISLLTLLALLLYLARLSAFAALSYSIPRIREATHASYAAAGHLYTLLGYLNDLAFAVVILFLVIVAFSRRSPAIATSTGAGSHY